jgi:flagellar hook-basal body complex protein FliE
MPIQFDPVPGLTPPQGQTTGQPSSGAAGFGDALQRLLGQVDASAGEANKAVSGMIEGTGDVHDAMIALQRAQTTLELTIQLRNKFVQAYQDIMRMPV